MKFPDRQINPDANEWYRKAKNKERERERQRKRNEYRSPKWISNLFAVIGREASFNATQFPFPPVVRAVSLFDHTDTVTFPED